MNRASRMLSELEVLLHDDHNTDDFCRIKLQCLKLMKFLSDSFKVVEILESTHYGTIKELCLKNACLIFCTVSSSAKLHTMKEMRPFEMVIIDEAAQVKECESSIPLQLPGVRHAILVGDEKQLPAMVISK
ncbi:P-loop containing nucleoside triphosphate hydrolases superfamily protein, partial [Perilla frutescens var. frutescens]